MSFAILMANTIAHTQPIVQRPPKIHPRYLLRERALAILLTSHVINAIIGTPTKNIKVPQAVSFWRLELHRKLLTGDQATPPNNTTISAMNNDSAMDAPTKMKNALNKTPMICPQPDAAGLAV